MTFKKNELICRGKYRIVGLIAEGAFARVWLAVETTSSRQVAIKELKSDSLGPDEFTEQKSRFEREIQIGARLSERDVTNFVRGLTTESYEPSDGTALPLLVLEYMPAGSLTELLHENPQGLPVAQAVRITRDVCEALRGLHSLGLVHRDVKSSNILFRSRDTAARLADFGTVQIPGETMGGGSRSLGSAGHHPGTWANMPDEQRHDRGPLSPTADIFALGCVLSDMLTGQSNRSDVPNELPGKLRRDVPPWLDRIVEKCLAKQPSERYQTVEELRQALDDADKAQGVAPDEGVAPAPIPERTGQPSLGAQSDAPAGPGPDRADNIISPVHSPGTRRAFPNAGDAIQVLLALIALTVTWIAFRNPQSFAQGLPDVITAAIGVVATIATIALSAPLVGRAVRAVQTPGGSTVLEFLALILGTGMIVVALVGLFLAFLAFLSRGPGAAIQTVTPTPPLTLASPPPFDTPTVAPTPMASANTWTPSPTASPTATSTASPVLPSSTPTATRTPNPPTNTWTLTPISPTSTWTPHPTGTWTPVPTATRPAPTKTPTPQPPTATRRLPTATPMSPTAALRTYAAPQLVAPANDASLGAGATVTLQWASVGPLAAGAHYLLAMQHSAGTSWVVTDSTSWTVPAWLKDYQPVTWWVAVCRGVAPGEYGTRPGSLASPASEQRRFSWSASGGGPAVIVTPPE